MKKIQKIALRIFIVSMLLCATTVIFMVWMAPQEFGITNKIAITSFVVGLASFLIWITTIILDIRNNVEKR